MCQRTGPRQIRGAEDPSRNPTMPSLMSTKPRTVLLEAHRERWTKVVSDLGSFPSSLMLSRDG